NVRGNDARRGVTCVHALNLERFLIPHSGAYRTQRRRKMEGATELTLTALRQLKAPPGAPREIDSMTFRSCAPLRNGVSSILGLDEVAEDWNRRSSGFEPRAL